MCAAAAGGSSSLASLSAAIGAAQHRGERAAWGGTTPSFTSSPSPAWPLPGSLQRGSGEGEGAFRELQTLWTTVASGLLQSAERSDRVGNHPTASRHELIKLAKTVESVVCYRRREGLR
eukprot:COSAG01_NODE_29105_length_645_cov_0.886447_1_plen_119_part_00